LKDFSARTSIIPKNTTMLKYYDPINKRLVYIKESATSEFWDDHWGQYTKQIKFSRSNRFIKKYLNTYLPDKNGVVLETGCGLGDKVYYMHHNGFKVIGIDFAKNTLINVKRRYAELNLVIGDCFSLPFKSNSFIACWSLGVIEHFFNGYDKIIIEINRVLENNGFLFLSFPCISPIRKIKAKLKLYQEINQLMLCNDFYQFALSENEVIQKICNLGFVLLEKIRYDAVKGLKDEISILKPILQNLYDSQNYFFRAIKYLLNTFLAPITGHMSFMVFKKQGYEEYN